MKILFGSINLLGSGKKLGLRFDRLQLLAELNARVAVHESPTGATKARRDATHREIAVVRSSPDAGKFKVGCRKFTDRRAVRPFC